MVHQRLLLHTLCGIAFATCCLSVDLVAADWPRFRGPNGTGIAADETPTPSEWDTEKNIKWTVDLPGAGMSSPIVVGDKVFVTCYSGYGIERGDPGEMENLKRHLVCIEAATGKILWDKSVKAEMPEDPYSGIGVPAHGYASHSPISDGENIYVFFGKSGALAFDMEGNQLWQKNLGKESDPRRWGSASSPILFENTLIVTASAESQAIVGLDKKTGEELWRQEASGIDNLWGTPVLVEVGDKTELVIGVPYEIWGLNPRNGKLRWYSEAMQNDSFNSSVVVNGETIYAIEGRGGGSIAVKAGGRGDVTESNVVWKGRDSSRFASPVVYKDRVYFFGNGVANCIDAKTGDKIFQARLEGSSSGDGNRGGGNRGGGGRGGRGGFGGGFGSSDYGSPVIADGKVYYTKGNGETFVIEAGTEFKQIAVNKITEDQESFGATPAISDGKIYLRSDKRLYCVGE